MAIRHNRSPPTNNNSPPRRYLIHDVPPDRCIPQNMSFHIFDALANRGSLPAHMVGQYDIVHVRLWACVIRDNDPHQLIENAKTLFSIFLRLISGFPVQTASDQFHHTSNLEPNGFLQWEDTSKNTHSRYIETTETFLNGYEEFLALTGIKFGWTSRLPGLIQDYGIEILQCRNEPFTNIAESLYSGNLPMGVNDVIQAMRQQQLSQHHGQDDRESKERMVDKLGEQLRRLCEMKDTEYMVPFTTMCLLARRI